MDDLLKKLEALRSWMSFRKKVLVAYSGGVDSSLVLKVAVEQLGADACGMLAISPSLPEGERREALETAANMGARIIERETHETEDPSYQSNAPNRCYFCKTHVYAELRRLAEEIGHAVPVDGMNAEDTLDLRPGRAAARELEIFSPLHELGFTKSDVRQAAKLFSLPNWNKPAAACLASRIPYGTIVTTKRLSQVEKAESQLRNLGIEEVRVRHHGDTARIEVPADQMDLVIRHRKQIAADMRSLGFHFIALDLDGFRSGSLNEPLRTKPRGASKTSV